jgi:hypothetical protein
MQQQPNESHSDFSERLHDAVAQLLHHSISDEPLASAREPH